MPASPRHPPAQGVTARVTKPQPSPALALGWPSSYPGSQTLSQLPGGSPSPQSGQLSALTFPLRVAQAAPHLVTTRWPTPCLPERSWVFLFAFPPRVPRCRGPCSRLPSSWGSRGPVAAPCSQLCLRGPHMGLPGAWTDGGWLVVGAGTKPLGALKPCDRTSKTREVLARRNGRSWS